MLNLERSATNYVTHKYLISKEKDWVTTYLTGGVWSYDYDGVSGSPGTNEVRQWDDYTNSDPLNDVANAKEAILESTGYEPNKLVMGYAVWTALKNHPDIIDRIKYGQTAGEGPARVTLEALAALFELDQILVSKAIENTAKEGQTASHSFIAGKKALLCYATPTPTLEEPTAGYTFSWTGYMGAAENGSRIKKYRIEKNASDRIEIEAAFDHKLVSADLGAFWDTLVG